VGSFRWQRKSRRRLEAFTSRKTRRYSKALKLYSLPRQEDLLMLTHWGGMESIFAGAKILNCEDKCPACYLAAFKW
jgi:hypothetical protein